MSLKPTTPAPRVQPVGVGRPAYGPGAAPLQNYGIVGDTAIFYAFIYTFRAAAKPLYPPTPRQRPKGI